MTFRPRAYVKAAKVFYDHSAGCSPSSAVLEEIVDALLTPKEKAAPEMYEALQQAVHAIPTTHGAFQTIRAALAKADGGQQ